MTSEKKTMPTRTEVYNAAAAITLPFFTAGDVLGKLGFHSIDSNHFAYRPTLRHLHKLKEQKHLDSSTRPEANLTIWWFRSRVVDTDDIPF